MDFQQLLAKMAELDQSVPEAITQETTPDLDQSVDECPADMSAPMAAPPAPPAPEPSMSLNLNAQGLDNIEDILKLVAKVNPDMPAATSMPALPSLGEPPALPTASPAPLSLPTLDKDDGDDMPTIKIGDDEGPEKKEKEEAWENEPDTCEKDVDFMNNKLAGGMNRPKGTFPKVAGGDNPMQRSRIDTRESIRAELLQRLAEAKGAK